MKQEGLTLTALAKRLGRPVPTVHGWLSGHRLPSLEAAVQIERATGGAVQPSAFVRADVADAAPCGGEPEAA